MKISLKSYALAIVVTLMAASSAFCQFSAGVELGLPIGSFSDGSNVGFGGSIRYDGAIQDKLNWTATGGFLSFGIKDLGVGATGSTTMIPIMGGVKYYFTETNKGMYAGADLGLVFASVSVNTGFGSGSVSETKFGFTPGIGYRAGAFDIAARFNLVSDLNYLGIRAAYVFGE
jgi:hypothetical protein